MQASLQINLLFALFVVILTGLSLTGFYILWVLMEISTLVFIFISASRAKESGVISLKYFVTQSFISMVLIINFMLLSSNQDSWAYLLYSVLVSWKLGLPPFHSWFLNLITDSSWFTFFLMSTAMKIIPLFLMTIFLTPMSIFTALVSVAAPALSGVSSLSLKKIMGLSSMFTTGWVIVSMAVNNSGWALIFTIYSMMLVMFCILMSAKPEKSLDSSVVTCIADAYIVFMVLLSMSGIPPFAGFFIKLYVITGLLDMGLFYLSAILVLISSLSVYMYIKTSFKYMSMLGASLTSEKPMNNSLASLTTLNLFSGILIFMIYM
uniref:NADH dehydrogenase subunit 2 n=1 Tax=Ergasilus tumidus TaxID=342420 RepID=UPI002434927D|nr:NADH dehydrogenase subunit 2 [Ergasilus tumidus]WEU66997.1 NADH dehydrogenase subunit 2 [Ergasilus tumidus]